MLAVNDCVHLREVIATRSNGDVAIRIHKCNKLVSCTVADHGILRAIGDPLPVCETCDLRSPRLADAVDHQAARLHALAVVRQSDQVAVVIPCHNYGKYLAQCLASVTSQTQPPAEVVVVDDAGDDAELVQRLCEQHGAKYLRVEHRHAYLTRQTGFDATVSPYIVFLDADDYLANTYLAECVEAMKDESVGVVTSDLMQFGDLTGAVHHEEINLERDNWIHAGSMVRRIALMSSESLHRAAPAKPFCEDWFVWRHLVRSGWKVSRINTPTYFYRRHADSLSKGGAGCTYYQWAALATEPITLVLACSGREQYWPRMIEWVRQQPRITDVVVIDSGSDLEFRRKIKVWLSSLEIHSTKYISLPESRGLADRDRWADKSAYYSVQNVMPRIYGPMRESVTTEYMLIVEDDVLPPVSAVETLLSHMGRNVAAVSGVVPSRFETGLAIARTEIAAPCLKLGGSGVQPVAASGFGCLLLRRSAMLGVPPFNSGGCGDFDTEFSEAITTSGWTWLLDWGVVCQHGEGLGMLSPDPGLAPWEVGYLSGSLPECSHRGERQGAVLCNIGCPSMQREPQSVFGCTKHGLVTLGKRRSDLKYCVECPDCDGLVQLTSTTV